MGQERRGDPKNVEPPVERDGGPRSRGGLTEGNAGDGARLGEHADTDVLAPAEVGDGLHDVVSAGDFENVRAHAGFWLAGDINRRLGLVLGARGSAPRAADDFDSSTIPSGGGGFLKLLLLLLLLS